MKYTRCFFLLVIAISASVLTLLVNSCKKDPYSLGLDLLPPGDTLGVKTVDTATVIAYSVIQDSVRSDKTTSNILGSIMDPTFGLTTASFSAQFNIKSEAPSFGTDPVLDSLVLMLKYSGVYGDSSATQHIHVYELSQDIYYDSVYYSNRVPEHFSTPIADVTVKADLKDSVTVGASKLSAHLRINLSRLSHYFGDKILYAPASALATNTAFVSFMKGLYIEATERSEGGSLMIFNMTSSLTKMTLYFHNATDDSLSFDFPIGTSSARFNTFNHNGYKNADPALRTQVLNHDTTLGKDRLYIQGLGGIRTRVRIPFVKDFGKLGNIAVNNAILVFRNFESDTALAPPTKLHMFSVDSLGRLGIIIDSDQGENYFDGNYNRTARTYKFRITRHVQDILLGKLKNYDFYILANDPTTNSLIPNRVQLIGTDPLLPVPAADRMQLEITYTKLK